MSYSAPLELLTDVSGSVTFGWADEGVYYARFTRCLSARLGAAFAARLRVAAQSGPVLRYFADARALESYDLLARSAFVRVVTDCRRKFEELTLLSWAGAEVGPAFLSTFGGSVVVLSDANDFEARLLATAPRARQKLASQPDSQHRPRWPLRR